MRYTVVIEYETALATRRAPVQVNATDREGAEHVARNYADEHMGEVVRVISVSAHGPDPDA